MHIISIANQKGGVGKSTLSSLFAYFLADKKSARVLAVDLDSQRNLSYTLRQCGIEIPTTALFADECIELPAVRKNIALIHATPQLANLERASAEEANRRVQTFAAHLEAMQEEFDYCLLDPPPTLGIRMVAALASADFVTVPIELEEYSTQAVKDMLRHTDHKAGPWTLIPAEDKDYARVAVVEAVIEAIEKGLRGVGQVPITVEAAL